MTSPKMDDRMREAWLERFSGSGPKFDENGRLADRSNYYADSWHEWQRAWRAALRQDSSGGVWKDRPADAWLQESDGYARGLAEGLEEGARMVEEWRFKIGNIKNIERYGEHGYMNAVAGAMDGCAGAIRASKIKPAKGEL